MYIVRMLVVILATGCYSSTKVTDLPGTVVYNDISLHRDSGTTNMQDCIDSVRLMTMRTFGRPIRNYYVMKFYMHGSRGQGHFSIDMPDGTYCGGELVLLPINDSVCRVTTLRKLPYSACLCLSQVDSIIRGPGRAFLLNSHKLKITDSSANFVRMLRR